MAVVGCYSLHLYCNSGGDDYGGDCPHRPLSGLGAEFTGPTEGDCIKQARKRGWTFNRDKSMAYCPGCNRKAKPHVD